MFYMMHKERKAVTTSLQSPCIATRNYKIGALSPTNDEEKRFLKKEQLTKKKKKIKRHSIFFMSFCI